MTPKESAKTARSNLSYFCGIYKGVIFPRRTEENYCLLDTTKIIGSFIFVCI